MNKNLNTTACYNHSMVTTDGYLVDEVLLDYTMSQDEIIKLIASYNLPVSIIVTITEI